MYRESNIDTCAQSGIMAVEEVALYLQKSTSWVYKNWKILGGRKLGGSLFFPSKGDLYEHLFGKREGVEVRLHPQGDQAHGSLVQNEKRGGKSGSRKEGRAKKSRAGCEDINRHGLLGVGQ